MRRRPAAPLVLRLSAMLLAAGNLPAGAGRRGRAKPAGGGGGGSKPARRGGMAMSSSTELPRLAQLPELRADLCVR